jgi:hypothetical protein
VSVKSAIWKKELCCRIDDFDHLNVLGWWDVAEKDYFFGGSSRKEFETEIKNCLIIIVSGGR